ncbi:MAG: Uma2 family endonuclease [Chloroflexi bacterium]|nr:Uma2 family endonuclease [Chloroflexota bacterium]
MTTSKPKLRTGTRMSLDEFLALGETDERMELIDGVLYVMPTATIDHQFLMRWICRFIEDYLYGFHDPPAEIHHDITTILSEELQRVVEPDLVVILAGRDDIRSVRHVEGVPDIVIEILSTDRSRDLVRKRQIYAEAGVREYWIFDPHNDTVLPLALQGNEYTERPALTAADALTTPLLHGLSIPLADIFHHRRRPPRDE